MSDKIKHTPFKNISRGNNELSSIIGDSIHVDKITKRHQHDHSQLDNKKFPIGNLNKSQFVGDDKKSIDNQSTLDDKIFSINDLNKSQFVDSDKTPVDSHSQLDLDGPLNLPSDGINSYNPNNPYTISGQLAAGQNDYNLTGQSNHIPEIMDDGITFDFENYHDYSNYDTLGNSPLSSGNPYETIEFKDPNSPLMNLDSNLDPDSDDLRFYVGFGWEQSKVVVRGGDLGLFGSLFYVNTGNGLTIGADASIEKWGELTQKFNQLGLSLPSFKFSDTFEIKSGKIWPDKLLYQDTVLELAGSDQIGYPGGLTTDKPTNVHADSSGVLPDAYRGNVFQVLGDNRYQSPKRYDELDYSNQLMQNVMNNASIQNKLDELSAMAGPLASVIPQPSSSPGPIVGRMSDKYGYIPAGVADADFIEMQQIQFGKQDKYPYYGFLDPVYNVIDYQLKWPITNFEWGSINWKKIDLKIDFRPPPVWKDLKKLGRKMSDLWPDDLFDWPKITIGNPFAGLKWNDVGNVFKSIANTISENKYIKKIGQGIGWAVDKIVGWGKKIKLPDWMKLPKIKFPKFKLPKFPKFGGGDSKLLEKLGGGLKKVAGAIGDAVEYITPHISISGNLNPIDSLKLPQFDIRNPLNILQSGFGGEALFKGRPGLRSAYIGKMPNGPTDLSRNTSRILAPLNQQKDGDRTYLKTSTSTPYALLGKKRYASLFDFYPNQSMDETSGGDRMTLANILTGTTPDDAYGIGGVGWVTSEKNGMPFYFKDLRDSSYIVFRAYIDGLVETLSPNWNSENYIGRSEPTYIYTNTTRNVTFDLKLTAQTGAELDSIYNKIRKLTSLTYPEYQNDIGLINPGKSYETVEEAIAEGNVAVGKIRMKAPLLSFRIGELYGNEHAEAMGFIDSLNYTFPDSSPWEFRKGQRVPKHVTCNITLKVLHSSVPDMNTGFYGYISNQMQQQEEETTTTQ